MPQAATATAWVDDADGPAELLTMLEAGRPVVVTTRQSSESVTKRSVSNLHNDAREAMSTLSEHLGVELPDLMPSTDELMRRLRSVDPIVSRTGAGRRFTHRVVVIDRAAEHGLVLVLILGSGTKHDAARNSPPAMVVADLLAAHDAALAWAKRMDRFLRHEWAIAPMMIELQNRNAWIGDRDRGLRFPTGPEALMVFWEMSVSRDHAEKILRQTVVGKRLRTESRMRDGTLRVAVGRVPPPGLARLRMREGARAGEVIWALDTPSVLEPLLPRVAVGYPESRTADSEPADQVANVRFALRAIGTDGWTDNDVGAELQRRGFSTDRYRSMHDPSAVSGTSGVATDDHQPGHVLKAIYSNLEVYESGCLQMSLGHGETIEVANLLPHDGKPWASSTDFARIRSVLKERRRAKGGYVRSTFTGLECTVDGVAAVLRTAPGQTQRGRRCYTATKEEEGLRHELRAGKQFLIEREDFARIVADAIAGAGNKARRLVPVDGDDAELARRNAVVAKVNARRASAVAHRDSFWEQVVGANKGGPTGALLQRVNEEYNQRHAAVEQYEAELARAEQHMQARRAEIKANPTPARTRRLLEMVESLRDPEVADYRRVWLRAIDDLTFTSEPVEAGGLRGADVHVDGRLVFGAHERYFTPIRGTIRSPVHSIANERAGEAVEQMRQGVPLSDTELPMIQKLRAWVAELFGATTECFPLGTCDDPRTLRIAVRLLIDGDTQEEVADELGEPLALVQRVHELYEPPMFRATWRAARGRVLEDAYSLQARADGLARYDELDACGHGRNTAQNAVHNDPQGAHLWEVVRGTGLRYLGACRSCDGRRLAKLSTPEPAGRVCLDCRSDRLGVLWPSDPYDRHLAHPRCWA